MKLCILCGDFPYIAGSKVYAPPITPLEALKGFRGGKGRGERLREGKLSGGETQECALTVGNFVCLCGSMFNDVDNYMDNLKISLDKCPVLDIY